MIGLESDKNGPLEEEVITNIQDAQFLYILLKVFLYFAWSSLPIFMPARDLFVIRIWYFMFSSALVESMFYVLLFHVCE